MWSSWDFWRWMDDVGLMRGWGLCDKAYICVEKLLESWSQNRSLTPQIRPYSAFMLPNFNENRPIISYLIKTIKKPQNEKPFHTHSKDPKTNPKLPSWPKNIDLSSPLALTKVHQFLEEGPIIFQVHIFHSNRPIPIPMPLQPCQSFTNLIPLILNLSTSKISSKYSSFPNCHQK